MEGVALVPSNPAAKHRVVCFLECEVHELRSDGQCAGNAVHHVTRFPFYFDGQDQATAIRLCNEFVTQMKVKA